MTKLKDDGIYFYYEGYIENVYYDGCIVVNYSRVFWTRGGHELPGNYSIDETGLYK